MYFINISDKAGNAETIYTYTDSEQQLVETVCKEVQPELNDIGLLCSYSQTIFLDKNAIDSDSYQNAVKIFTAAISKYLKGELK